MVLHSHWPANTIQFLSAWAILNTQQGFCFHFSGPTRATNSCSWGRLSVGLTSPLTKEYYLGPSPWTHR